MKSCSVLLEIGHDCQPKALTTSFRLSKDQIASFLERGMLRIDFNLDTNLLDTIVKKVAPNRRPVHFRRRSSSGRRPTRMGRPLPGPPIQCVVRLPERWNFPPNPLHHFRRATNAGPSIRIARRRTDDNRLAKHLDSCEVPARTTGSLNWSHRC